MTELSRLARLLFQITRKQIWAGGKGSSTEWPEAIEHSWKRDVFWSISPEVELGGHRMRVCVSSVMHSEYNSPSENNRHTVRVFVDDELKYPGGTYWRFSWPWLWSARVARYEREDGGKTSPVDTRSDLIKEAQERVHGGVSSHQVEVPSPEALAAEREVDDLAQRHKAWSAAGRAAE